VSALPREDYVPVLGGSLDGQRVRYQGHTLYVPVLNRPELTAYVPAESAPLPVSEFYHIEVYVTWRSADGTPAYYIEQHEFDRIAREHEDAARLETLREALGGDPPKPADLYAPYMAGEVWWCGDEYCDCTQAQIVGWDYETPFRMGYRVLWRGSFHSGDPGRSARDELKACRDYLRLYVPHVAAMIRWDGVDD
jgi:hypothetical protein